MANDSVIVDGVKFVRETTGNRHVVVVDRGWIFAGDLTRENGRLLLQNAVHVFKWEQIGFDGMLKDPKSSKVTLKKLDQPVDIPQNAEIFSIPVDANWGV